MNKKLLTDIRKIKQIQTDYICSVKKANEVVPIVEKSLKWTEWAENTVKDAPDNFETPEMKQSFSLIQDSLQSELPSFSINPQILGGTVNAANATLSEVVFDRINSSGYNLKPHSSWISQSNKSYAALQNEQSIVDEIEKMLFTPNLKDEFVEAINKYSKVSSGISSYQDAAICMRNVLEHFQGSLFELVRKSGSVSQAKKRMHWEHISNYLSLGGMGSSQSLLLLSKKGTYDEIHSQLTKIAKNSTSNPTSILVTYYSKWLDFLYTSINLMDPKHLI